MNGTLTLPELVAKLSKVERAQPIAFTAWTDALKRKTALVGTEKRVCPYVMIRKLSRVRPFVGSRYEQAVRNQQAREGETPDFVAGSSRYERVAGPLVRYKGTNNLCLAVQFNESAGARQVSRPLYVAKRAEHEPWKVVAHADVAPWVDDTGGSPAARQGVEQAVLWRTYGLKNLVAVSMNGQRYRVRGTS